ncbi:TonB-dependent receptor domain-containing protein [uncultured Sphingomonas sp.]|uniref:TonB-dependent receptor domain-containing protein n=1 Tax=uncultured Sphingomonas sp. TaxID=158754 RepID=UPI0035CC0A8D
MKSSHLFAATALRGALASSVLAAGLTAVSASAQTTAPLPPCGPNQTKDQAANCTPVPGADPTDTHQATTPNNTATDTTGTRPGEQAYQNQADSPEPDNSVVVTGTRLSRPGIVSQVPLTSITADELLSQGNINVGDALNELPQLRATYSQANSTRFIGTSGLNLLDLRGLGTARTLVLVDGRRHVTSVPGTSAVDTNTIPTDLLERVDVVTGGESAIYGSDAIAGVVNFILKDNFSGLKLNAQGGATTYGDHGQEYVSAIWGKNFAEGRGNIAVAGELAHVDAVYYRDRDFETGSYSGRNQFNLQENVAPENLLPPQFSASDGIPDNGFYSGVRNGTISDGGILNAVCNTATLANTARCRQNTNYLTYYAGVPSYNTQSFLTAYVGQRYAFTPNGQLTFSNPSLDFRDITAGGSTNTVGGLGSTLYETGMISPRQDRIALNTLGHYDFSEGLTAYFEGKYTRTVQNQEGQPTFFQGGSYGTFSCSNPFLGSTNLTTLQSIGYCANPTTGTFTTSRFNVDYGGRGEYDRRELFRVVGGVRGTFNHDWKYDASVSYGQFNSQNFSTNNLILQNYANAINAVLAPASFSGSNYVLNGAGAKVICAINATTDTDPACFPINTFGQGVGDARAINYFNYTSHRNQFSNQLDANAYVSGNLSQLFSFPGGPIGFVIGGEYRREQSKSIWDTLTSNPAALTFLNAIQPFLPPTLEVKEGYVELQAPLLKDMRFVRELTISGAARVSNYNNTGGTTYTYNGGATYSPADFIRFRGNYSHSVRVPTQSDLYSPFSQNYASIADPCDVINIGTMPNYRANCAAAGIPTGFINTVARTQTISYLSGGNPNLTPETSDSFTFGGVIQPTHLVPGMSVTIDYYNITVHNLIASLGAQAILNACYNNSTGINNNFCALVTRNPDGTFANNGILSAGINFAKQKTSGIDIDYAYNHTMGNGDKVGLSLLATWIAQRDNYINPQIPGYATRQKSDLGDPEFEFNLTASYTHGPFTLRYQAQYISPMTIGAYEAQNYFDGRVPTNADVYPQVYYPSVVYHNFRLAATVNKQFQVYGGVDNAFNTLPPFGLFGNDANSAIYDPYGRTVYAGIKVNY